MTGVSGSGKSTLVHDVLYAAIKRAKGSSEKRVGAFKKLEGSEFITDAVLVDQAPIGRTPRSNPVTYLKAFDPIRELFASTKDARSRGLTASHFSFNVPGGRCEACQGEGEVRVEMQFLADVFVPCDQCDGKRFKPQVLDVKYRGRSIRQVLDLTVREALTFFGSSPKVLRRLQVLDEIGLGYLRLGQPATTLSGGEAQRIKIAAHLSSNSGERLLYVLDEPTTGLHFDDIAKLLTAFRKLLEAGTRWSSSSTIWMSIKTADYIIDLGPEGGEDGGFVVADRHSRTGGAGRGVTHRAIPPAGSGGRTFACVCLGPVGRVRAGRAGQVGRRDRQERVDGASASLAVLLPACPAFRRSCPAQAQVPFEQAMQRTGKPRCLHPAADRADAQGRSVSRGGRAACEARCRSAGRSTARGDCGGDQHLSGGADRFPQARRLHRRSAHAARSGCGVRQRTAGDRNRGRSRPRCWTRCATAMRDDNPRVRLEAMYAFGVLAVEPGGSRRREMLRTSGPDLASMIGAVDPFQRYAALRVIGRVFERRLQDDPIDEYVGDAVDRRSERSEQGRCSRPRCRRSAPCGTNARVQGLMDLFQSLRQGRHGRRGAGRGRPHRASVERAAAGLAAGLEERGAEGHRDRGSGARGRSRQACRGPDRAGHRAERRPGAGRQLRVGDAVGADTLDPIVEALAEVHGCAIGRAGISSKSAPAARRHSPAISRIPIPRFERIS